MPSNILKVIEGWSHGDIDLSGIHLTAPEAYRNLQRITSQNRRKIPYEDDVLRRFQLCIFFLMRSECEAPRAKRATFANSLQPFLDDALSKINSNVKSWAVAGGNLTGLAQQLGGYGVLLVLPREVSRSVWEIYLSRSTPRFQEVGTLSVGHLVFWK